MTGDQIIAYAQYGFGGSDTDPTVTAAMWLAFYNQALQEMYHFLPTEELARGSLVLDTTITLAGGAAAYPVGTDKILSVADDSTLVPFHPVPEAAPLLIDSNPYLVPSTPVYYLDTVKSMIYVRPTSIDSIWVSYLVPPAQYTVTTAAQTDIPQPFQMALANLMTAYAYEQEEDTAQAQIYRTKVKDLVAAGLAVSPAPVEASGPAPAEAQAT